MHSKTKPAIGILLLLLVLLSVWPAIAENNDGTAGKDHMTLYLPGP